MRNTLYHTIYDELLELNPENRKEEVKESYEITCLQNRLPEPSSKKTKKEVKMTKTKYSIFKCLHRGEKGFTLIELLIVVAILGIIAAVVIPNLGSFMVTGKLSAANSEVENVKSASLAYYAEHSQWPGDSDDLDIFLAGNITSTYGFDASYGWVLNATGGWDDEGLDWSPGTQGVDGGHGEWIREP
jgi:prepilin-type N-terminal cleavage/methylation domain-containing protein